MKSLLTAGAWAYPGKFNVTQINEFSKGFSQAIPVDEREELWVGRLAIIYAGERVQLIDDPHLFDQINTLRTLKGPNADSRPLISETIAGYIRQGLQSGMEYDHEVVNALIEMINPHIGNPINLVRKQPGPKPVSTEDAQSPSQPYKPMRPFVRVQAGKAEQDSIPELQVLTGPDDRKKMENLFKRYISEDDFSTFPGFCLKLDSIVKHYADELGTAPPDQDMEEESEEEGQETEEEASDTDDENHLVETTEDDEPGDDEDSEQEAKASQVLAFDFESVKEKIEAAFKAEHMDPASLSYFARSHQISVELKTAVLSLAKMDNLQNTLAGIVKFDRLIATPGKKGQMIVCICL